MGRPAICGKCAKSAYRFEKKNCSKWEKKKPIFGLDIKGWRFAGILKYPWTAIKSTPKPAKPNIAHIKACLSLLVSADLVKAGFLLIRK